MSRGGKLLLSFLHSNSSDNYICRIGTAATPSIAVHEQLRRWKEYASRCINNIPPFIDWYSRGKNINKSCLALR
jgi:hypothetical protein